MKKFLLILFLLFIFSACEWYLNSAPPEYLKQFTVYKEGDGIIIYFILADREGQMTTCDGEGSLIVIATHYNQTKELKLLSFGFPVKKDKFIKTTIGRGPFKQKAILFPMQRISFNSFPYREDDLRKNNWKGLVKFTFNGGGRFFSAEESFYF